MKNKKDPNKQKKPQPMKNIHNRQETNSNLSLKNAIWEKKNNPKLKINQPQTPHSPFWMETDIEEFTSVTGKQGLWMLTYFKT